MTRDAHSSDAARRQRVGTALAAAGLAGLFAGILEGVRVAAESPSAGAGALNLALCWGLWWLAALLIGLPWIVGAAAPPLRIRPSLLIAGGACAALGGLFTVLFGLPALGGISPGLRPLAAVALTGLAIGLSLGLAPLVAAAFAALLERIPPSSLPRWLAPLLLTLAVLGATWLVAGVEVRWAPIPLLGLGLLALFVRPLRRPGLIAAALGPLALIVGLIGGYGASASAIRGPAPHGLALGLAIERFEALSDDDGDGYGDAFGGGDCDDTNPAVNPEALEIPGNGVDENCRAGDVRPRLKRPRLPRTKKPVFRTAKPVERPMIILLVLDSIRADHFGDADELTPNLAKFQRQGTTFTRAYSPAPSTRLAIPALLAGRWVGYTDYEERMGHYFTDEEVPVLPQVLGARNYRTVAILPPFVHARLHGIDRGFGQYVNFGRGGRVRAAKGRTEPLAVEDALEVLADDHPFPVFIYMHVDGGHHPYSKTGAEVGDDTPYGRYRGEVERMDRDLKPLLDRIEAIAQDRPLVLAFTADHGEAFGEHGWHFHGRNVHDEVLHVPLVLYSPGRIPAGQRIDTPVDLLDLGVTLAKAGGARLPGAHGQSLWGLIDGLDPPKDPRPLFFAARVLWAPSPVITAVQRWPLKLIRRMDTGDEELYDLAADPREQSNLRETRPQAAANLRGLLYTWADGGNGPAGRRVKDRPREAGGKRFDE